MKKEKIQWIIGLSIIALLAGLIFKQSFSVGEVSSGSSMKIAKEIYKLLLEKSSINERSVLEIELVLRKFAHLLEYMLYGTIVYGIMMKLTHRKWLGLTLVLLMTYPLPYIDEFKIQVMTAGRTPQLLDVWIDWLGLSMAISIGIFYSLLNWKAMNISREEE